MSLFRLRVQMWKEGRLVQCVFLHGLSCKLFMSLLVTHSTAIPSLLLLHSLPFFSYLSYVFHPFALSLLFVNKIQQSSTITVPFMCRGLQLYCVCCVHCVLCSFISFFLLAPASTFASLCVCCYLIQKMYRLRGVSLKRYCRMSGWKSVLLVAA